MSPESLKLGVVYHSSGGRVAVESGPRQLGWTSLDNKIGQHVYWWPTMEKFVKDGGKILDDGTIVWPKDLFEMPGYNRPVGVVRILPDLANVPPKPKPTIAELEALLEKEGQSNVNLKPDGTIELSEGEKLSAMRPLGGSGPQETAEIGVNEETGRIESRQPSETPIPDGDCGSNEIAGRHGHELQGTSPKNATPGTHEMQGVDTSKKDEPTVDEDKPVDIFEALAGRAIRSKDFAKELGIPTQVLLDRVAADSRFATVHAGWIKHA